MEWKLIDPKLWRGEKKMTMDHAVIIEIDDGTVIYPFIKCTPPPHEDGR